MKEFFTVLILFIISSPVAGQKYIKGRIVQDSTGTHIPGCSIFLTNTSVGTISDNKGNFELYNIPEGKHELVVSSIGFQTWSVSFTNDQLPLDLEIKLNIRVTEMKNVIVEESVEEGWTKWGRMFFNNFIGTTSNASQCKVKNESAIKFRYFKKSNRLIAYSDEPIIVENRALGYIVSYKLEDFELNFGQQTMSFEGFTFFSELDAKKKSDRYEKNRKKAFNGSILHFMRSLYNNRLQEEGFEVQRMRKAENIEKTRVRGVYKEYHEYLAKRRLGKIKADRSNELSKDSLDYYQEVLFQNDFLTEYDPWLLSADSLVLEEENDVKFIHFNDFLSINYRNAQEEKEYSKFDPSPGKNGQRSTVILLNDKIIAIDRNGNYYNPRDFFASAYWGWSTKISNMLPVDYQ